MSPEKPEDHGNEATVVATKPHLNHTIRTLLLGLAGLVVVIGIVTWRVLDRKSSVPAASGPKCSQAILRQAAAVIDPAKQRQLLPIVNSIQKTTHYYDQDPNCLYVVLNYYINISDAAHARMYLDKFNQVYKPTVPLNPLLRASPTSRPVAELKANVEFLEKVNGQNFTRMQEPKGL